MTSEAKDHVIKQGLDEEDIYIAWSMAEWNVALGIGGFLVCFGYVLTGMLVLFLSLFLFNKFRTGERGSKAHYFWRIGMNKSPKGLPWAPPAYATRFDN